jgi:hypothetical protein
MFSNSNQRNDFNGQPEIINKSSFADFESVRPLSPKEKAAQPLFSFLRHFFITSTFA